MGDVTGCHGDVETSGTDGSSKVLRMSSETPITPPLKLHYTITPSAKPNNAYRIPSQPSSRLRMEHQRVNSHRCIVHLNSHPSSRGHAILFDVALDLLPRLLHFSTTSCGSGPFALGTMDQRHHATAIMRAHHSTNALSSCSIRDGPTMMPWSLGTSAL